MAIDAHADDLHDRAEKKEYQRVGEATEVALRVLAEKVGLPGYADMPGSLEHLSKRERATFCNEFWQQENRRVSLRGFVPSSVHESFHRHAYACSCLADSTAAHTAQ